MNHMKVFQGENMATPSFIVIISHQFQHRVIYTCLKLTPVYLLLLKAVCMHAQLLRRVQLFMNPRTVALQDPLPVEFSREEYWSGSLFPTLGDLPDPGSNLCLLCFLHWQVDFFF